MKQNQHSIDGFIPRRTTSQLGERHESSQPVRSAVPVSRTQELGAIGSDVVGNARPGRAIGRADIDDSLRDIDDHDVKKPSRRERRRQRREVGKARPSSRRKKITLFIVITVAVALLGIGGFLFIKTILASNNVFRGGFLDLVQNQPLKKDANGRSNFIIFGTAEDDENGEHGGANLTDSIMVFSVDQDKKDAFIISLPRDLWVDYAETCTVGNQGKLNAAYFCASDDGADEPAGAAALQAKAGEILGMDIQYYAHVNFSVVVQAVDAVGGVDVTINSEDPRGILDRNFDWKCGYRCYYVKYANGERAHLDGEHALALARARNASGGYGLPNGNFDREKNQQLVIKALREKAVSAGTLTNLGAVTGLIDALGTNLRTNIETKEIRTLMALGQEIKTDNIRSLTLVDEANYLVKTGNISGQSIVQPAAGLYDYSDIQAYIKKNASSDPVEREGAVVTVLNGSGTPGAAQTEADKVAEAGITVDGIDNAPDGTYEAIEIYQVDSSKTATAEKLKSLYNVTIKTTAPPVSVTGETSFVIIVGRAETTTDAAN